jgi:ubiquinone/menaquinone biosynthesis C-methylase UbiE
MGDSDKPWADHYFDTVICTFSFHHYLNPIKVLKEMNRVLISVGTIIIHDTWFPIVFRQIVNLFIIFFRNEGNFHIYSSLTMYVLLKLCGFKMVD